MTWISENPKLCSSIKKLHLGNICSNVVFKLPSRLDWITHLSIDGIRSRGTCDLSGSLNRFKAIEINCLESGATLKLPTDLGEVETLILGSNNHYDHNNKYGIKLTLPESLDSLKKCLIGEMLSGSKLKFPYILKNLEVLKIGKIDHQAELIFEDSQNRLLVSNSTFNTTSDFNLPKAVLDNLRSLTISLNHHDIKKKSSWSKLEELTLNDIENSVTFEPKALTNLKSLTFGRLGFRDYYLRESKICLPILTNLRSLGISSSRDLEKIQFLNSLENLDSVKISLIRPDEPESLFGLLGYVAGIHSLQKQHDWCALTLSKTLTSLKIGSIWSDTLCELGLFKNVKKFI